jgi:hypothetical protein
MFSLLQSLPCRVGYIFWSLLKLFVSFLLWIVLTLFVGCIAVSLMMGADANARLSCGHMVCCLAVVGLHGPQAMCRVYGFRVTRPQGQIYGKHLLVVDEFWSILLSVSLAAYSCSIVRLDHVSVDAHVIQWNLWIATLQNEAILWIKDTSFGPKWLFQEQFIPWNKVTSEIRTLLACPRGVHISQVSL